MEAASMSAGLVTRRAFRPVLCWIVASSFLLLFRFHEIQSRKATIEFTISMEGRPKQTFRTTLNDLPYRAGERCGVGWKSLVIQSEDAESFQTNCFVWYGGAAFGHITLPRTRGRMDLDISPAVESVRIIGSEENKSFDKITHESFALPTGRYTVEAKFARFSMEKSVEVNRNQTTRVAIAPRVTTLQLSSDPGPAEFELTSSNPPEISVQGSTPSIIQGLPAGEYQLAIARGNYRKDLPVILTAGKPTNELKVEFRYAKLSISSEPPDADISDGRRVIGKTPGTFDLQPGSYRLQIAKDGYFGTNISLTLSDTDNRALSVSLVNVSFIEAIERARRQLASLSPDLERALADVEQALKVKPTDETALQLKRAIEFNRHLRKAKQFQKEGDYDRAFSEADAAEKLSTANDEHVLALKRDLARGREAAFAAKAEAWRNRPQKLVQQFTSTMRYQEIFEPQLIRLRGSPEEARAVVMRALARQPAWSVKHDQKIDEETVTIQAELKQFAWKQYVVLVIGQTDENELTLCFKLFSLILTKVELFKRSESSSEDNYQPEPGPAWNSDFVKKRRQREIEELKKRILDEFR